MNSMTPWKKQGQWAILTYGKRFILIFGKSVTDLRTNVPMYRQTALLWRCEDVRQSLNSYLVSCSPGQWWPQRFLRAWEGARGASKGLGRAFEGPGKASGRAGVAIEGDVLERQKERKIICGDIHVICGVSIKVVLRGLWTHSMDHCYLNTCFPANESGGRAV